MHIQTTDTLRVEQLHEAMLDAYNDYNVPMDLSLQQFQKMTRERCYKPGQSLAMMDGDTIAAFWLIGENAGIEAATRYAISVGTRPQFRRQGLADKLFQDIRKQALSEACRQIVLEVLTENERAYAAYRKMGFIKRRHVQLSRGNYSSFEHPGGQHKTREIPLAEARALAVDLGDWAPTWQNSLGSMDQTPDDALCLAACDGQEVIGLGCFVRSSGQIKQLAGKPGASKDVLANLLLSTANKLCPPAGEDGMRYYVNIDTGDQDILNVLKSHGWDHYIDQYELVCPLT